MALLKRMCGTDEDPNPFFQEINWAFDGLEHPFSPFAVVRIPSGTHHTIADAVKRMFANGACEVSVIPCPSSDIDLEGYILYPSMPTKDNVESFLQYVSGAFRSSRVLRAAHTGHLLAALSTHRKDKWVRVAGTKKCYVQIGDEYSPPIPMDPNRPAPPHLNFEKIELFLRSPEFMGEPGIVTLRGENEDTTLVWKPCM